MIMKISPETIAVLNQCRVSAQILVYANADAAERISPDVAIEMHVFLKYSEAILHETACAVLSSLLERQGVTVETSSPAV